MAATGLGYLFPTQMGRGINTSFESDSVRRGTMHRIRLNKLRILSFQARRGWYIHKVVSVIKTPVAHTPH